MSEPFRVGIAGFGNVGTGLARLMLQHASLLEERAGRPIEIAGIAVRTPSRARGVELPGHVEITDDWRRLVASSRIDAIVEVIGVGADGTPATALEIARAALAAGKHFITANKALISAHGAELHALADRNGVACLYEASVGAGIPAIHALQLGLVANRFHAIHGIVNGTCNFILTNLDNDARLTMESCVAEAQRLGYAEPDPTFDVGGHDAAFKLTILASLAFGGRFGVGDVVCEGITNLAQVEFQHARKLGLALKLLASAVYTDAGVALQVGPAFVPATHVIAGVRGVFNAVLVDAWPIGETMYYGPGAGPDSTASGLLADVFSAARGAASAYPLTIPADSGQVARAGNIHQRHYLRVFGETEEIRPILESVSGRIEPCEGGLALTTETLPLSSVDALRSKIRQKGIADGDVAHVRFVFD